MTAIEYLIGVFYQAFGGVVSMISGFFSGISNMFNISLYVERINELLASVGALGYLYVIVGFLAIVAVIAGLVILIIFLIRRAVRLRRQRVNTAAMIREIARLNKDLAYIHNFMDKKLQQELKQEESEDEEGDEYANSRFSKLLAVDKKYEGGNGEILHNDFTLQDVCTNFRNFSAYRMRLFYDEEIVREFVASLAAVRLIILQGISGTGKTSLPYSFGKFLKNDSFIQPVQPSWRERSEMLGFFNEFTKKYKEPEFLRNLYEAHYSNNVHITVLDEMNIARVEYYFAEFLSVLEIPRKEEWIVEIVSKVQKDDPKLIVEGKMLLPPNMWFVGTANNDDSTFAVSDKVYDRAMIIDIDKKFVPFQVDEGEPMPLDNRVLYELFAKAKEDYIIDQVNIDKVAELDSYVIEHFRIAFGNRILMQIYNFVPAYIACGGTEINGIDYILVKKVFRKFGSLSASYLKKEVDGLINKLDSLWGKDTFPQSRELLDRLKQGK